MVVEKTVEKTVELAEKTVEKTVELARTIGLKTLVILSLSSMLCLLYTSDAADD